MKNKSRSSINHFLSKGKACFGKKSTCHWMVVDVLNREITRVNLIRFLVWNLQLELLFQSHYNLHSVQAIQPQIFLKMYIRGHLQI